MESTCLGHTLDVVAGLLFQRGRRMPANIHIQADNTAREARNQHLFMFASSLVSKHVFRSATVGFLVVGHTHNAVDQRFSVVSTELAKQDVLETPEDQVGLWNSSGGG